MPDGFHFKINGAEVKPESVDLTELLKVLRSFCFAVRATSENSGDVFLALTKVEPGSDSLTLVGSPEAMFATSRITKAFTEQRLQSIPQKAQRHLRNMLSTMANNPTWESLEVVGNGSLVGNFLLTSGTEFLPGQVTYNGVTTIYGKCVRIGGTVRPAADIKPINGNEISIRLASMQLARSVGKRLYETIGLEGTAHWDIETDDLVEFVADRITEYSEQNGQGHKLTSMQAFEELAVAAEGRWENVDPEEFINELRRD